MSKILDGIDDIDESSAHPDDGGELQPGPGRESFKIAQFWKSQINSHDQAYSRWIKRGNSVIKRFRDERNRIDEEGQRRMNLLWSNIKVMKPAIYSKCPTAIVDRKWLDRDPTARLSCQILERSLRNEVQTSGFHPSMNMAVLDRLLPGRGIVWARYVPKIGEGVSIPAPTVNGIEDPLFVIGEETGDKRLTEETDKEEKLEETNEQVLEENIEIDYVDWRDFYCFPAKARTWMEVQAIGKMVYISKKEAIERFGEKIGKALKADTNPITSGNAHTQTYANTSIFQDINERNIVVFEIWNKSDKRVYWLSTGYEYLCDVMDDPLELTKFFPVPPPLMSTTTNDTIVPVPDFIEWQDQAIQIDELTQRIAMLSKACKVAGVYNAVHTSINRMFNESIENELIPVDQWAAFADQGGIKGAIDFLPLDVIQSCIETLQKVRQQAMVDLDQVTGLSDVIRGTSDSRETLGGLRLKNNNAGTRLSESQEDIARFCRDVITIMAEIACKHFSDETLIESSGIMYEDALQPDTIMRELMPPQPSAAAPAPQKPQQPPQQPMGMPAPGQPPAQPANPTAQLGGGASNIVPFPGAPQQAPQMPTLPQAQPQLPDPHVIAMMKVMKAIELLRKDVSRQYRIDIETDSTIFADKLQDREDANGFLTALGGYMKQLENINNIPEAMPLFAKALQWGVRRYRTGRDLESEIDTFCETMKKKSKEMIANPPKDPDQQKAEAEIAQMQMEGKIQAENDQRDAAKQAQNDQREAVIQQQQDQREQQKMMLEMELEKERNAMEREKMQMEMQQAREEHNAKLMEIRANTHAKAQEHVIDLHSQKKDLQVRQEEHKLDKKELVHKKQEQEMKHKEKMKPKPKKKSA